MSREIRDLYEAGDRRLGQPDCSPSFPAGRFERIVVKPNWVKHQEDERFPIEALVATAARVLDAVVEACVRKYAGAERIVVGDVPLQSCHWETLTQQAGLAGLRRKYLFEKAGHSVPRPAPRAF